MGFQSRTYNTSSNRVIFSGIKNKKEDASQFFLSDYYSYGFNGYERDDELKGNGNSYDFGARILDPRIGRFLSTDPLLHSFPWNSPYSFAENKVINGVDVDGESFGWFMERLFGHLMSFDASLKKANENELTGDKRTFYLYMKGAQNSLFGMANASDPSYAMFSKLENVVTGAFNENANWEDFLHAVGYYDPALMAQGLEDLYETATGQKVGASQDQVDFARGQVLGVIVGIVVSRKAVKFANVKFGGVNNISGSAQRATSTVKTQRVGQWMSKAEYDNFVKTGEIPRTNVLTKGKEGYIKQASKGDYYVEFDVDQSLLVNKNAELGWSLIKSKNQMHLKLSEKNGQTLAAPIGSNIKHVSTK